MQGFVQGADRQQTTLLPECLDDWVDEEMVLRCPSYSQALKWARLECRSYKISEPEIEPLGGPDHDELPLFLRRPPETEYLG
jgi:hypothetical protein